MAGQLLIAETVFVFPDPCLQELTKAYEEWYDTNHSVVAISRGRHPRGAFHCCTTTLLHSEASSELAESAFNDDTGCFSEQDRSITPASLISDHQFYKGKNETRKENRETSPQVFEMLESMLGLEHLYPVNAFYIEEKHHRHGSYKGLKASMREVTVSWMVEVALEHTNSQEALHLAVKTLDRFLASTATCFPPSKLQLLAVACLFVASKHEDVCRPTVLQLTDIAANSFSAEDLLEMESHVLSVIEYRLSSPTASTFLTLLSEALSVNRDVFALASYLAEVCLLDYAAVGVPSSKLAKASLLMAAFHFQSHAVIDGLHSLLPNITIFHKDLIWEKLMGLYELVLGPTYVVQSNPHFSCLYLPLHEKFSSMEWGHISLVNPSFRVLSNRRCCI